MMSPRYFPLVRTQYAKPGTDVEHGVQLMEQYEDR